MRTHCYCAPMCLFETCGRDPCGPRPCYDLRRIDPHMGPATDYIQCGVKNLTQGIGGTYFNL